ncbi:MAG: hypothetical protein M1819_003342 [Sarea resinae]|nr:MAG: hypothetical protein M1819_003342 [Sarea resinae]
MPPARSAKRRSATDETAKKSCATAANQRAVRKRAQNRISQQCFREKQLAHTRQLESFIAAIKETNETNETRADGQVMRQPLLNAHLSLIEENQRMRDALLRMRKKFLSLSSAAAAAADDEIFQTILADNRNERQGSSLDSPAVSQSPTNAGECAAGLSEKEPVAVTLPQRNESASQLTASVGDADASTLNAAPPGVTLANVAERFSSYPSHIDAGLEETIPNNVFSENVAPDLNSMSIDPGHEESCPHRHQPVDPYQPERNNMTDSLHPLEGEFRMQFDSLDASFLSMLPETLPNFLPSPKIASPIVAPGSLRRPLSATSACLMATKVEETCVIYISQRLGLGVSVEPTGSTGEFSARLESLKKEYLHSVSQQIVDDLAKASINIIASYSGLRPYLYGIGANDIMESIMRWRLSPTVGNRLAIPEPFRPTPLQFLSPRHPVAIDFLNWSAIRDQLILRSDLDVDEITSEIFRNTVIEIPHLEVALNIFDLFKTKISPEDPSLKHAGDAEPSNSGAGLTHLAQMPPLQLKEDVNLLTDSFLQDISWRVHLGEQERMRSTGNRLSQSPPSASNADIRKSVLAIRYGLDNLSQWKLSKEFCERYPVLDCSTAASSYSMVSSRLVMSF